MKKTSFLIAFLLVSYSIFAQRGIFVDAGFQFSLGYIPEQELSVQKESEAYTFNTAFWLRTHPLFGIGFGVGVRNYRGIPESAVFEPTDLGTTSLTRFDVYLSPAFIVPLFTRESWKGRIVLYPQLGLWYKGRYHDESINKFLSPTIAFNADLIIRRLSFGVTYRASQTQLVSNKWRVDHVLVKPALEFRIGLFFLDHF
jgi:hypothetical protein